MSPAPTINGAYGRKPLPTSALAPGALESQDAPRTGIRNLVAIWTWLGWIANYYIVLTLIAVLAALRWHKSLATVVAVLAVLTAVPADLGQRLMSRTLGSWLARHAADYFGIQMYYVDYETLEKSTTPVIFTLEPHDVLPVSMIGFNEHLKQVPGHPCVGLMTSTVFNLPGMKSVYRWLDGHSVDKHTFSRLLAGGRSVCFCPGGVQEVIHLQHDRETVLFLKKRLGFAKLALRHGTPVVPTFTFGLAGTYSHRFMRGKFAESLARKIGFLPGVFWGLGGMPYGPPRSRRLAVVVGTPVPLPERQGDGEPSDAEVERYHEDFLAAITALYDAHKGFFGMEKVALRII